MSLIGNMQVKGKSLLSNRSRQDLKSFTLPKGIISCKETSTCSHRPEIATFHDNIVTALNESMLVHISSVKNNHKTPPTIPGWDAEMDDDREE